MSLVNDSSEPVRRGRKRSEESRQAILRATYELVGEVGYAGLSLEGIAARSRTGKQTIYRWWPSKADVLLEVLATKAETHIGLADQGCYPADLHAFLTDTFTLGSRPQVVRMLVALIAEAQVNPGFYERLWAGFLERRREALWVVLNRAKERGDLPPVPPPATVIDIVFGSLWYRLLATRQPLDQRLADDLVATLAGQCPGCPGCSAA
ncbi:TetR family transcriptional regulator [Microtetraspora sp. NBRC 13810]|uniref:TetR/AcrR family transcriptional regulator n=1 Tax=Microtetraspora sp. NBRC 13810 TaxID=3030990 RepID=UPI0024A4D15D|nr:TetR/AcrR family transcriptional regulator [Microtetraspora sp. NBRC 13810]GLW08476.1 TetR family transcriptional regulator [Microtetraspora sp. NBRC 13810]